MKVLAILYTRFRDVQKLVMASMIAILMLTPVFWKPDMMTGWRVAFVNFNPFHHLIEIIRQPMLGELPTLRTMATVLGIFVVFQTLSYFLYRKYIRRIVFWV